MSFIFDKENVNSCLVLKFTPLPCLTVVVYDWFCQPVGCNDFAKSDDSKSTFEVFQMELVPSFWSKCRDKREYFYVAAASVYCPELCTSPTGQKLLNPQASSNTVSRNGRKSKPFWNHISLKIVLPVEKITAAECTNSHVRTFSDKTALSSEWCLNPSRVSVGVKLHWTTQNWSYISHKNHMIWWMEGKSHLKCSDVQFTVR